jgi:hypothetical protein
MLYHHCPGKPDGINIEWDTSALNTAEENI